MSTPFEQLLASLGLISSPNQGPPNLSKRIDLSNQKISEAESKILETILKENKFVEELILSKNPDLDIKKIEEILKVNKSLVSLDLSLKLFFLQNASN